MTKIPSVEEKVEEFMSQYAWGKFFTIELEQEVRENLFQALTAQREAGAREAVEEMTRFAAISRYDGERYYSVSESTIKALTPLPDKE